MAFEYNDDKKETGTDISLEVAGLDGEIPVTSASFSEEAETSEVQFNDSYSQNIALTGVTYSGSFEISGRNEDLHDAVFTGGAENEGLTTELPAYVSALTFTDGAGNEYTFSNVMMTSRSKDAPADDRTTDSYDFSAEKLAKSTGD